MRVSGLISVLLFSLLSGAVWAEKTKLSIVSWNIHNYNLSDGLVEGVYREQYPKPELEKKALRQVIERHSPDILILQEVGGLPYLNEIRRDLSQIGLEYTDLYIHKAEDTERMIAALSKEPIEVIETNLQNFNYLGERITAKRGLLHIRTRLDSLPIDLFGMHLKSRYTDYPQDPNSAERREKEARVIRDYIRKILNQSPESRILLMGDINDRYGSPAYRRLTQVSGSNLLMELMAKDSSGFAWTYHYEKERVWEQVDFAFVSPYLFDSENISVKARILDDPEVAIASDHRPLLIQLQIVEK